MYNINILNNKSNTLLINYNNKGLLLDTGYDKEDTNKIIHYLKNNNIILESVIVSHYHEDHIQGVKRIKEAFSNVKFFSSEITKFIYENNWFENTLYSGLVDVSHDVGIEFLTLENSFKFYEVNIDILKSNGHCYGNLLFKIDDYLFCPDIIISNNDFLPFISDVSAYFDEIDFLKNIQDINTVISSHCPFNMSLETFNEALDNTKKIINKYLKNIETLIGSGCNWNELIINSIKSNNRTRCFESDMTQEQYGYTTYVIKNILKYLENIGIIKILYDNEKINIEKVNL